jgi:hypothetical protein
MLQKLRPTSSTTLSSASLRWAPTTTRPRPTRLRRVGGCITTFLWPRTLRTSFLWISRFVGLVVCGTRFWCCCRVLCTKLASLTRKAGKCVCKSARRSDRTDGLLMSQFFSSSFFLLLWFGCLRIECGIFVVSPAGCLKPTSGEVGFASGKRGSRQSFSCILHHSDLSGGS